MTYTTDEEVCFAIEVRVPLRFAAAFAAAMTGDDEDIILAAEHADARAHPRRARRRRRRSSSWPTRPPRSRRCATSASRCPAAAAPSPSASAPPACENHFRSLEQRSDEELQRLHDGDECAAAGAAAQAPRTGVAVRIVAFRVDGVPRGKQRPAFDSRKKGKRGFTRAQTSSYEDEVQKAWQSAGRVDLGDGPLGGVVTAVHRRPRDHYTATGALSAKGLRMPLPVCKPDADNVLKIVLDALHCPVNMGRLAFTDDTADRPGALRAPLGDRRRGRAHRRAAVEHRHRRRPCGARAARRRRRSRRPRRGDRRGARDARRRRAARRARPEPARRPPRRRARPLRGPRTPRKPPRCWTPSASTRTAASRTSATAVCASPTTAARTGAP